MQLLCVPAVRHCLGFKLLDGAVAGAVFVGLVGLACGKRPLKLAQGADRNVLLITIDTLRQVCTNAATWRRRRGSSG